MKRSIPAKPYEGFSLQTLHDTALSICSENGLELPGETDERLFQIYQTLLRLDNHAENLGREMWQYKVRWQGAERSIENFKKAIATAESRVDKICDSVRIICDRIVASTVTHGQKNGMVLLLSELVKNWRISNHIDDRDIPF